MIHWNFCYTYTKLKQSDHLGVIKRQKESKESLKYPKMAPFLSLFCKENLENFRNGAEK